MIAEFIVKKIKNFHIINKKTFSTKLFWRKFANFVPKFAGVISRYCKRLWQITKK